MNWDYIKRAYSPQVLGFALCSLLSLSRAQKLGDPIPNDRGSHYIWAWQLIIATSAFGIVYNGVCLAMMLSLDDSNKMPFYSINVSINAIDLLFSLNAVVFGSLDYKHGYVYGGTSACFIESFTVFTLAIWSIWAIVGMSWVARNDICNKHKITQQEMIIYIICSLFYSSTVVIVALVVPYGGYGITETGVLCELSLSTKLGTPIMYFFGWYVPAGYLMYNLYNTYRSIRQAQSVLDRRDIKERAKGRYIQMVMKMGCFILTFSIYCLNLGQSLYEWSTNRHVSGIYSAMATYSSTIVQCLINPTLFFYLNPDLRDKFWSIFVIRILKGLQYLGLLNIIGICIGRKIKISNTRIRTIAVHPVTSSNASTSNKSSKFFPNACTETFTIQYEKNKTKATSFAMLMPLMSPKQTSAEEIDYKDVNTWLSDPMLFDVMKDFGRKEYTIENFLFFDEVRYYFFKGLEIIEILESFLEDREDPQDELPQELLDKWDDLESKGNRIYSLYITVPSAPLEVNIPADIRSEIGKVFEVRNISVSKPIEGQWKSESAPLEMKYPSLLESFHNGQEIIILVNKYVHIFDSSVNVVQEIIVSDIWPRFRGSNYRLVAESMHMMQFGKSIK